MDEKQVANNEVTETPQETTPVKTEQPATEVQTVDKQPVAKETVVDRFDKHPRFQQLRQEKQEALERARILEARLQQAETGQGIKPQSQEPQDPFSDLPPDERETARQFVNKYVIPVVEQRYHPFVQEVQNERLNRQIDEAKTFASQYGMNFDETLPEIVDFLSRPENKGRLTAKEAFLTLYAEDLFTASKNQGAEQLEKQKMDLIEKKKAANMEHSTVAPNAIIHSDEAARSRMTRDERQAADIKAAVELWKQGIKHPDVRK